MCDPSIADLSSMKYTPRGCNKEIFNTYRYPYTTFHPYLPAGTITGISANVSCLGGGNLVRNEKFSYNQSNNQ